MAGNKTREDVGLQDTVPLRFKSTPFIKRKVDPMTNIDDGPDLALDDIEVANPAEVPAAQGEIEEDEEGGQDQDDGGRVVE